jgi:hypothetical protein
MLTVCKGDVVNFAWEGMESIHLVDAKTPKQDGEWMLDDACQRQPQGSLPYQCMHARTHTGSYRDSSSQAVRAAVRVPPAASAASGHRRPAAQQWVRRQQGCNKQRAQQEWCRTLLSLACQQLGEHPEPCEAPAACQPPTAPSQRARPAGHARHLKSPLPHASLAA